MKISCLLIFILIATTGAAQNLQLHYDFRHDRKYVTSTLEMFKTDKLGSTFWFVDMDYASGDPNKSVSLSYWEIARYFTLPIGNRSFSATIQYNDGNAVWGPLHSVWLAGASWFVPVANGNVSVDCLFRRMDVSDAPDFQATLVWFFPLLNEKFQFTGFLDCWTQDLAGAKKIIWLTEPQIWYQFSPNFAVGAEVEISKNFLYDLYLTKIKIFPTVGIKWIF